MPVLVEVSVTPLGKEGASLSDAIVATLRAAEVAGVNYEIGPLGTSLEGDLDTVLEVVRAMHEACFHLGYPRVITSVRIDDRRDKELSLHLRVETVTRKLAEQATHLREN
jgi:uncharacterized protein (TIGR00106 family)